MSYKVKEIYYTIQGEGFNLGRPAVFCRFSNCNLWSGREEDRDKAICKFCDTDFVGTDGENGGEFSAEELSKKINSIWPNDNNKFLVFTGGEPLLQIDEKLISNIKKHGFEIAVETNGTVNAPVSIDWLTVSPKEGSKFIQKSGQELKVVYPQGFDLKELENYDFQHFYLSPMITSDHSLNKNNIEACVEYCLANPKWKMTYQCHKIWKIR